MKLLLETQGFIWWDSDPANEVWLSAASVWEIVIKAQLGKLSLRLPLLDILSRSR